tara:strand:+ start:5944 stop:6204 length:261 start_codon:yes stop_codon:yes gene_type:complete
LSISPLYISFYVKEPYLNNSLQKMYLSIIFLPLMGAVLGGLFGRFVGPKGASIITTGCLFTSLFLSCIAFYEVGLCGCSTHIKLIS